MNPANRTAVLKYLRGHSVMTLATSGSDGPWASAVFYVSEGFDFYFFSDPATRHGRSLAATPRAAAAIHDDVADWRLVQGIQLEGMVNRLHGTEAAAALALYATKFPLVGNGVQSHAAIAKAVANANLYRLAADRIHFIDNSQGFGRRSTLRRDE